MKLRLANINDAQDILNIYKPYVKNTTITFEYDVPSLDEFKNRISTIYENFPYIVCKIDDAIVGYACITIPNEKSKKFHDKFGFNLVGTFTNSGYKFGKWIDVIWMEKNLIDYSLTPENITPISLIENNIIKDVFNKYI